MSNDKIAGARVKIVAGPAVGLYAILETVNRSTWRGDARLGDGRLARGIPLKHVEVVPEEPETDRLKLLDRIRKLHAKAESARSIGSEAEAASFAAAVQKMLAKYKLSLSDLEMAQMEREEPVGEGHFFDENRSRADWSDFLVMAIARALVGRETDRKIAEFMITTLKRTALELSDKEARTFRKQQRRTVGETTHENRNFRTAWLNGFVSRVAERYAEDDRETEKEQKKSGGASLIVLRSKSLAQVDSFVKDNIQLGRA